MGSGNDSGVVLRHALAHAAELHRMCVVNRQQPTHAAKALGLGRLQTCGAVRLLKAVKRIPSPERCAVIVMLDWGMEDADIAEIFGRSERWARLVREQAAEIRAAEPIASDLEYLDEGLQPGDPSPEEIVRLGEVIRSQRIGLPVGERTARPLGGMRHFAWNGRHAFFSVIASKWAGG